MKKLILTTFFLAFCLLNSIAQKNKEINLHEFLIVVEKTDNGFKLTSDEGCGWTDLTFSAKPYGVQFVSENGKTTQPKENNKNTESGKVESLLFSISKKGDSVTLVGLEGTAWTRLEFSGEKQAINQFGMTDLD